MSIQWPRVVVVSGTIAMWAYVAVSYFTQPPLVSPTELRADLRSIGYPTKASPSGSESAIDKAPFLTSLSQEYRTDPSSEADLLKFYRTAFESEGWIPITVFRGRTMLHEFCKNRVLASIVIPSDMAVRNYTISFESGQLAAKCPREKDSKDTGVANAVRP